MIIGNNIAEDCGCMKEAANVIGFMGMYGLISLIGIILMNGYNKAQVSHREEISEEWIWFWGFGWPILLTTFVPGTIIYKIYNKGIIQEYCYNRPVNKIAKIIEARRLKREAKHKFTEEEMLVVNDLSERR